MTISKNLVIMLLLNMIFLSGCTLVYDTLRVEVPKNYVGWCYIIPLTNTNVKASLVVDGKCQADANGVVLIPANIFDVRKDHIVKVYETGTDISDEMRYAGSVYSTKSTDSVKYNYIHFYLPSMKERTIPDATQYWRDKGYKYDSIGYKKFDSLLKAGNIVF